MWCLPFSGDYLPANFQHGPKPPRTLCRILCRQCLALRDDPVVGPKPDRPMPEPCLYQTMIHGQDISPIFWIDGGLYLPCCVIAIHSGAGLPSSASRHGAGRQLKAHQKTYSLLLKDEYSSVPGIRNCVLETPVWISASFSLCALETGWLGVRKPAE